MKLDREMQLAVLRRLADDYPNLVQGLQKLPELRQESLVATLHYLQEHGLIDAKMQQMMGGEWMVLGARATATGMDFLQDDGGLTAILGVVTIRLHDDTIKSLIEAKIQASDLASPEKKRYIDQLRELPGETTKHLLLKLVDLGLEKGPAAIDAIGKFLSGLPG